MFVDISSWYSTDTASWDNVFDAATRLVAELAAFVASLASHRVALAGVRLRRPRDRARVATARAREAVAVFVRRLGRRRHRGGRGARRLRVRIA